MTTNMRQESFKPIEVVKISYLKNLNHKVAIENLKPEIQAKVKDNNLRVATR